MAFSAVMHHAWMLSHGEDEGGVGHGKHTPVLVTQYSNWLRATFAYLRDLGPVFSAMKYVEMTLLQQDRGDDIFIWFDEPFGAWTESGSPPPVKDLEVPDAHWYRINGCDTWIALREPMASRPPLWTVRYLMVTKVNHCDEYLSWEGSPDETGNYLWWVPGKGNEQPIKASL